MSRLARLAALLLAVAALGTTPESRAQSVTVNGTTFTNNGLVGVGRVDNALRDSFKETFGSLSGLALDLASWKRSATGTYSATLYTQPDRGYVKAGVTTNYHPRRHKFTISLRPDANGSSKQDQLSLSLIQTTLLVESPTVLMTSLDPTITGSASRSFATRLPQAYNNLLAIDAEGIALLPDGTFFVSDEYGPYIYRFGADGTLLGATRPPEALVPKRNGQDSFSSDSAAAGQPSPSPSQPTFGRANNKGLEGLALSADGRTLFAMLQSATRQDDGGSSGGQNRYTRLLAYDVTNPASPTLTSEWVMPLPLYTDANKAQQVAEQHELVALNATQFLVLAHDGSGRGADSTKSLYRAVHLYDVSGATNIAGGAFDSASSPIAQNGVLASSIVPATFAVLVDINDSTQLTKFGLNNSSNDNSDTLASGWESLALAPALDATAPNDYFLFVGNDNDFSTSNGSQDGNSYSASPNIDTMVLVYRLTLPTALAAPAIITAPASTAVQLGQTATFNVSASGNPAVSYQWTKNGAALAGANSATLTVPNAQAADAGAYAVVVTNANGSVTSLAATLAVNGANAPIFTTQPSSQTIATGSTVVFLAAATNSPTYQWQHDGATIAGATSRMLVVASAGATAAGNYTIVATNSSGSVTSTAGALAVVNVAPGDVGRLINLSVLANIGSAEPPLTVGTALGGAGTSGAKPLLIRAAGPSLTQFGVSGALADPTMTLNNTTTSPAVVVATNDNWGGSATLSNAFASVGAFAYSSITSKDAALLQSEQTALTLGNYTVVVSGVSGATGSVIAELYDATPAGTFTATTPRLVNVSVLKQIPAATTLTAGFAIGGTVAKTVLVRVIGPRLGQPPFGISDTMPDPRLDLFSISGPTTLVASNDNWGGDPQLSTYGTAVGAFAVTDGASKDAMLLVTLAPGNYTAQASSANNVGGLALVEVYEVP